MFCKHPNTQHICGLYDIILRDYTIPIPDDGGFHGLQAFFWNLVVVVKVVNIRRIAESFSGHVLDDFVF